MHERCLNATRSDWQNYGGRGIRVCDRWSGAFGFPNWLDDMGEKPSPRHSLDRIDVNGNYEASNCRWATPSEQAQNQRRWQTEVSA